MDKILSVSIASYNVEKFLGQTLDSCLVPEIMEKLEVIVVNDGSKDGTAAVAEEYVKKAPDTFVPRHEAQMNWYRTAMEQLTRLNVREMWLFALRAGKAYRVERRNVEAYEEETR